MKIHSLLVLSLILSSCATIQKAIPIVKEVVEQKGEPSEAQVPVASPTPVVVEATPTPAEKTPSIIYSPITAWDSEKSFIAQGENEANAILKDPCFKNSVLEAKFTENKGLTNAQIYKKFVDASPMKVGIYMFTGGWKEKLNHTVAYEGDPISMNRAYVTTATYVGSTSLHEAFGHGLGFSHYTPQMNPKSIPYILNAIYEKCAKVLGFKVKY